MYVLSYFQQQLYFVWPDDNGHPRNKKWMTVKSTYTKPNQIPNFRNVFFINVIKKIAIAFHVCELPHFIIYFIILFFYRR